MKRTILTTVLALSLSLGANSVYAQQGVKWTNAASNPQILTWQNVMFVLLAVYIP
jgi:hypothetical protein